MADLAHLTRFLADTLQASFPEGVPAKGHPRLWTLLSTSHHTDLTPDWYLMGRSLADALTDSPEFAVAVAAPRPVRTP